MKDDRVGDAQMIQIDQCLCCTRYEPIFGQVYEVMNDIGVNVAQVLDDLQMSYTNNEEYVRMSRVEEYINQPRAGKIDLTKVLKDQNNDAAGLDDLWGPGIVMDWSLTPLEEQKPHINWRQAIDDDGSRLGRLASWQDVNAGYSSSIGSGPNITATSNGSVAVTNNNMNNKQAMDSYSGTELKSYIDEGKAIAEQKLDLALTNYTNHGDEVKKAIGNSDDLDVMSVIAAGTAMNNNENYADIIAKYRATAQRLGTKNPALIWTAMNTSENIVKMYIDGTLDTYLDPPPEGTEPTVNKPDADNVTWTEAAEKIKKGIEKEGTSSTNGLSLYPAIVYLSAGMVNSVKTTKFDGAEWGFPFTEATINDDAEKMIVMTAPFREIRSNSRGTYQHEGVDLCTADCNERPDKNYAFCAVKDGKVIVAGLDSWCNAIYVAHHDGTFSRYLHCRRVLVNEGDEVQKGQEIGIMGDTGSPGSIHLHLEFGTQNPSNLGYERTTSVENCGIDPFSCWAPPSGSDPVTGKPMWQL